MLGQKSVTSAWERIENQPRFRRKRLFENRIDEVQDADDEASSSEGPRRKKVKLSNASVMRTTPPRSSTPISTEKANVNFKTPLEPLSQALPPTPESMHELTLPHSIQPALPNTAATIIVEK